jgi:hypothetical protein
MEGRCSNGLREAAFTGFRRVNSKFHVNKRFSENSYMTAEIKKNATSGGGRHASGNSMSLPGVFEKNIRTRLNF